MYFSHKKFKKIKPAYHIALALTFFAISVAFRFTLLPLDSADPFVTFYPAIILSFYFCGAFSGLVVAVFSGLVGSYYFIPPYNQLSISFQIPTSIIFFSITSGLIGVFSAKQHRSIEHLTTILDNEMIGSMMLKRRKIMWCNKAMSTILGYAQLELMGSSTKMLFADMATFEEVGRDAYPLKEGAPYRKQFEMRKADGNSIWVDVSGSTISYNENMSLWLVNDITELKRLEIKLKNQINYDYLTGLYSRGWFMNQSEIELNRSVRYDSPLSLLMIDIDFFKRVNDTYGHQAGDLVLKSFADISGQALREFDMCGRLGGEEFAILLPETTNDSALQAAERLRTAVENANIQLDSGGPIIRITISIGVSSLIFNENDVSLLISRADAALYEAKNSGRNKVVSL